MDTIVYFKQSMRTKTKKNRDANFFRLSTDTRKVKLSISNADSYNETLIGFVDDATEGVDREYDAMVFPSSDQLAIYSYINKAKFVIQGLHQDARKVSLGVDIPELSEYHITIEETEGFSKEYDIVLFDKVLNVSHSLTRSGAYRFESGVANDDSRFEIRINGEISHSTPKVVDESYSVDKHGISIIGESLLALPVHHLVITDLAGRKFFDNTVRLHENSRIPYDFDSEQAYIVSVDGIVKKVIVK